MEHRWGQRRAVHQRVHLRTVNGLAAVGYIVSVSISGAFIKTPLPAVPLSVIVVSFAGEKGRSRSRASSVVEAQVVRGSSEGIALEWCELNPEFVRALGEIPTRVERFEDSTVTSESRT